MTDVIQERIKSLEQRLALDPQSPLFARLASYYLKAGRTHDALRLCDDGLANYPFYSTAHLVKGRVLVELGMLAEAKHEYEVVHDVMPTNETIARLAASIDLGPSSDLTPASTETFIEEVVVEEPPPRESPIADQFVETQPREQPAPESTAEATTVAEDAFGLTTPLTPEPEPLPPGVYEVPGMGVTEVPQGVTEVVNVVSEPATYTTAEPEEPPITTTDYGFGVAEAPPTIEPTATESALDMQQIDEPQPPTSDYGFASTTEAPLATEPLPVEPEPVAGDDAFGAPIEGTPSPSAIEPAQAVAAAEPISEPPTGEAPPDWFEAFSQLQQPTAEAAEPPPSAPAEEENPFAIFGQDTTAGGTTAEESLDEFAGRIRMELFGTEDTLTLDDYLHPPSAPTEPADPIGELAEKLKSSPRITPPVINFSEKVPRTGAEGEAAPGSAILTPTLAEIYVEQGWYDDAIRAYRSLAQTKPAEKDKFEQRIIEIEELKRKHT